MFVHLPTFVLLQQLVVELHHLLELAQLQQALAQVESYRQANLLQRLPVLAVPVHLQGWEGWMCREVKKGETERKV